MEVRSFVPGSELTPIIKCYHLITLPWMTGPVQKTRVVASCQAYDSRHAIQHLAKKSCEETLMKIIMNNSENEMMSIKLRTSMYCTIMSCQT